MIKKFFSMLIVINIMLSVVSVTSFAEAPVYEYSKIVYFKGENQINAITSGDITAKVKVRSTTATDKLLFLTFLYKNDVLLEVSMDETPDAVSSAAVTYEATVSVPSDITNIKIVSLLWKNAKDMEAICSSSIFPNSTVKLTSLSVEGVEIPDFSPDKYEYTVEIKPDLVYAPYIRYTALDNGSDVQINDAVEFPGKSTVVVTSSDGSTSATYTVNYTCNDVVKIVTANPVDTLQYVSYKQNLQVATQIFPDRDLSLIPLPWVSEQIAGSDYITCPVSSLSTYTFAIRRGAKISTYGQSDLKGENARSYNESTGWTMDSTGWDTSALNNWANDEICACTTHENEHLANGECYCILDGSGNCTGVSRIGNGIDYFPEGALASTDSQKLYVGTKYDNRKQGWIYYDYRGGTANQINRDHGFCALTDRYTKYFSASTFDQNDNVVSGGITITKRNSVGQFVTFEWDDYLPNDYFNF